MRQTFIFRSNWNLNPLLWIPLLESTASIAVRKRIPAGSPSSGKKTNLLDNRSGLDIITLWQILQVNKTFILIDYTGREFYTLMNQVSNVLKSQGVQKKMIEWQFMCHQFMSTRCHLNARLCPYWSRPFRSLCRIQCGTRWPLASTTVSILLIWLYLNCFNKILLFVIIWN